MSNQFPELKPSLLMCSQLRSLLKSIQKEPAACPQLISYFQSHNTTQILRYRQLLPEQVFFQLLGNLQVQQFPKEHCLIQKNTVCREGWVLLHGCVSLYEEIPNKLNETQLMLIGNAECGQLLSPIPSKTQPYKILVESKIATFLRIETEFNLRVLKKVHQTELEAFSHTLRHHTVFKGFTKTQLMSIIPKFIPKQYSYGQSIYRLKEAVTHMYFITAGEVEIQKDYFSNPIRIVRLQKGQLFGLEGINNSELMGQAVHQYTAKTTSYRLQVLTVSISLLKALEEDYSFMRDNIEAFFQRTINYNHLYEKSLNVSKSANRLQLVKLKRPKKGKNKNKKICFQWWGLPCKKNVIAKNFFANNFTTKKPALPPEYHFDSIERIQQLRKRIIEPKNYEQAYQSVSPWNSCYVPKSFKIRSKKPCANLKKIEKTDKTKKQLYSYAKSQANFCDRLSLE